MVFWPASAERIAEPGIGLKLFADILLHTSLFILPA